MAVNFSHSQNLSSNSPFCLPHSSNDVSVENLVLDQFIYKQFIINISDPKTYLNCWEFLASLR